MKKLVLGLFATMVFGVPASAQKLSESAQKDLLNVQMASVVNASKAFYVKGQTYDGFIKAMLIPSPTVPSQDEFFRKVFSYVSNNTPQCEILTGDNSSMVRFVTDLSKNTKNQGTAATVYSAKKKWWQLLINAAANIGLDIIGVPHEPIDFFPEP